jgi:hypothetical protein
LEETRRKWEAVATHREQQGQGSLLWVLFGGLMLAVVFARSDQMGLTLIAITASLAIPIVALRKNAAMRAQHRQERAELEKQLLELRSKMEAQRRLCEETGG